MAMHPQMFFDGSFQAIFKFLLCALKRITLGRVVDLKTLRKPRISIRHEKHTNISKPNDVMYSVHMLGVNCHGGS